MEFKGTKYPMSVSPHPRYNDSFTVDTKGFHYNPTKKEAIANANLFENSLELLETLNKLVESIYADAIKMSDVKKAKDLINRTIQ